MTSCVHVVVILPRSYFFTSIDRKPQIQNEHKRSSENNYNIYIYNINSHCHSNTISVLAWLARFFTSLVENRRLRKIKHFSGTTVRGQCSNERRQREEEEVCPCLSYPVSSRGSYPWRRAWHSRGSRGAGSRADRQQSGTRTHGSTAASLSTPSGGRHRQALCSISHPFKDITFVIP